VNYFKLSSSFKRQLREAAIIHEGN
jgi:hypothetical protein